MNFIYFSTLYSSKVQRGEDYDIETKFIHLDFTYKMQNKEDEYLEYYVQSNNGKKYVDNIKIIEYNMDKIMEYWYNGDKKKIEEYKHLIMLDLETKDLKKMSKGDDFVEEVNKKVTELNERETFKSAMTYEQDQKLILNTEKKISFNEGVQERNIEIAKSMLARNMDLSLISEITGLSIDEVKNLK